MNWPLIDGWITIAYQLAFFSYLILARTDYPAGDRMRRRSDFWISFSCVLFSVLVVVTTIGTGSSFFWWFGGAYIGIQLLTIILMVTRPANHPLRMPSEGRVLIVALCSFINAILVLVLVLNQSG